MNHPKVSVIIPVYNAGQYLRACLDCVMNQTLRDIEIICVDDGSEDSSPAIMREYHGRDKRIRVLTQENRGAGPARNKGIGSAQGEYVCFLDADDCYPEPDTLEKLYAKACENHALICGGSFSEVRPSGELITSYDPEMLWGYTFTEEGWIEYRDYQFDYGYHRFLYSREMLIQHDIFFPSLQRFQDPPFFVRAMIQADRFYAIPDVTYRYRSIDRTGSIQISKEKTRDLLLGLTMNLALAQENDLQKLFELTVKRCSRDIKPILNAAVEFHDSEINAALSKLNIAASEVMNGRPNAFFQMQAKNELLKSEVGVLQGKVNALQNKANTLQSDLDHVHASVSFRIGRVITWLPRKVRGGVWCFRDHGAGYTARRALYHMGLWKDEEANKNRRGCMSQPKVSVIIPVYNAEKYLRECLDSVVNQTLKDIEIICVDDGSTDGSPAILREYEAKDSRIKVLTQENQFAGVARNHGMEIASGRYYAFLDSDDYYLPDALSRMFELCEQYELDYIKAGYYRVEPGKEPYDTPYTVNKTVNNKDLGRRLSFPADIESLRKAPDVPWNGLYRASFLKDNRIVFNNFRAVDDHSFFVNCVIHAKRAMIINDHVVCYRVNQATSLVGTRHKHFQCQIDNYYLVRRIIKNLDRSHKRKLLQGEMNEVFHWYNKLYPAADPFYQRQMYSQLSTFILDFDESDVGEPFLHAMPSRALYYSIRRKTGNSHLRDKFWGGIQCYQDHGAGYTVRRVLYHMGLWKDEEAN